jgi:hypothetical protein
MTTTAATKGRQARIASRAKSAAHHQLRVKRSRALAVMLKEPTRIATPIGPASAMSADLRLT